MISNLPEGFIPLVEDEAWRLSGEQKQRIDIARHSYRIQKYCYDEAASALDITEQKLMEDIDQ